MHEHAELIMPPCPLDMVEKVARKALEPHRIGHLWGEIPCEEYIDIVHFYDYFIVGGNYSGIKNRVLPSSTDLEETTPVAGWAPKLNLVYNEDDVTGNVLPVGALNTRHGCHTLVVINQKGELRHFLQKKVWNGYLHQDATWNGGVLEGIEMCKEYMNRYKEEYKTIPQADWLAVTLDCHH